MIVEYPVNKPDDALNQLKQLFSFPPEKRRKMLKDFRKQMSLGLKGEPSLFGMYHTFIPQPGGNESGLSLAIDLGGTNLRVMMVDLVEKKAHILNSESSVLSGEEMNTTSAVLFRRIAEEVIRLVQTYGEKQISVGFTFSYPMKMSRRNSGVITRLTKQLTASGLVGNDPFDLLMKEIHQINPAEGKRLFPRAIVNDTVTELVYGAYLYSKEKSGYSCDVGGIIGTGCNFACVVNEEIINMECGNFDAPSLPKTPYDDFMDKTSPNPGEQRMEKLIAGGYLGQIGELVIRDFMESKNLVVTKNEDIKDKVLSRDLSKLEAADSPEQVSGLLDNWGVAANSFGILKELAGVVSGRAAEVSATAIGAIAGYIDPGLKKKHIIPMDGSGFGKHYLFKERMEQALEDLLPQGDFKLIYLPDGSGLGAAVAALIE